MDALTALQTRNSANLLCEPGPNPTQLEAIFQAGLRACDHGCLTPWKFLVIEGNARQKFGELIVSVKQSMSGGSIDPELADKLRLKPFRAPTIIVVVATVEDHPKIPSIEQVLSAGAAAQMMMVAAHALDLGAIWRSGSLMFAPEMLTGLGLAETDQIVGFLYVGSKTAVKPLPVRNTQEFVEYWPPKPQAG